MTVVCPLLYCGSIKINYSSVSLTLPNRILPQPYIYKQAVESGGWYLLRRTCKRVALFACPVMSVGQLFQKLISPTQNGFMINPG